MTRTATPTTTENRTYGLPLLLSTRDVARTLRVTPEVVRHWRDTGYLIPPTGIGEGKRPRLRWRRAEFIDWMRKHGLLEEAGLESEITA